LPARHRRQQPLLASGGPYGPSLTNSHIVRHASILSNAQHRSTIGYGTRCPKRVKALIRTVPPEWPTATGSISCIEPLQARRRLPLQRRLASCTYEKSFASDAFHRCFLRLWQYANQRRNRQKLQMAFEKPSRQRDLSGSVA
jgi:hypothetical protein